MDPDNLERVATIIDLLERFKERMTQATTRRTASTVFSRRAQEASIERTLPPAVSQELIAFGSHELERAPTVAGQEKLVTLASMMSKGRSLAFMQSGAEKTRRRTVHFGGHSREDGDDFNDFARMLQRSMSRAMSRAYSSRRSMTGNFARSMSKMDRSMSKMDRSMSKMDRSMSKMDRSMSRGHNLIDRQQSVSDREYMKQRYVSDSIESSTEMDKKISKDSSVDWTPNDSSVDWGSSESSVNLKDPDIDDDGFSRSGTNPARQSFLDHKLESGLFSDPELLSDSEEGTSRQGKFKKLKSSKSPIRFSFEEKKSLKGLHPKEKRRASVMFAGLSELSEISDQSLRRQSSSPLEFNESFGRTDTVGTSASEAEAAMGFKLVEQFGEDAMIHIAAASPDVLRQLLDRITQYLKDDLGKLLDELLAKGQQTELRLQQAEKNLQNAIETAEYQELETVQMAGQLDDLKHLKEESRQQAKQMQRQLEEIEVMKNKLMNVETQAELQKLHTIKIKKTQDEELQRLRQTIHQKDTELERRATLLAQAPSSLLSNEELPETERRSGDITEGGILKLPTKRRLSALNRLLDTPEAAFTFNVQREVSSMETESEVSHPPTPRQALIIDEMTRRLSELEVELRFARQADNIMKQLNETIETLTLDITAAEKEKASLKNRLDNLESEHVDEVHKLEEQLRQSDQKVQSLGKDKENLEYQAKVGMETLDAAVLSRDKLILELQSLKTELETEKEEIRNDWKQKHEILQAEYDELQNSSKSLRNELQKLREEKEEISKKHGLDSSKCLSEEQRLKDNLTKRTEELLKKQNELTTANEKIVSLEQSLEMTKNSHNEDRLKTIEDISTARSLLDEAETKYKLLLQNHQKAKEEVLVLAEQLAMEKQKEERSKEAEGTIELSKKTIAQLHDDLRRITKEKDDMIKELELKIKAVEVEKDQLLLELGRTGDESIRSLQQQLATAEENIGQLKILSEKQFVECRALENEKAHLLENLSIARKEKDEANVNNELLNTMLGNERISHKSEINKVKAELMENDRKIIELEAQIEILRTELAGSEALISDLRSQIAGESSELSTVAEDEMSRRHQEELDAMKEANELLTCDLESVQQDLGTAKAQLSRQTEEITAAYENRTALENQLTAQKVEFMGLIEEFQRAADRLKTNLDEKEKKHQELQDTCNHLSAKVQDLECIRVRGEQDYGSLGEELSRLRTQLSELRSERKTTENQLAQILVRLQERETAALGLNENIVELQNALRQAEEMFQEMQDERIKSSSEEYDARLYQLQEAIAKMSEGYDFDKSLWFGRLNQSQKENVQLRARLLTLMASLSSLNERLFQLQSLTAPSACCQLLSACCCPSTVVSSSFAEEAPTVRGCQEYIMLSPSSTKGTCSEISSAQFDRRSVHAHMLPRVASETPSSGHESEFLDEIYHSTGFVSPHRNTLPFILVPSSKGPAARVAALQNPLFSSETGQRVTMRLS